MKLLAGLLLAFVSAVTLNWGFFVQHHASNTLERLSMRHPWTALRLLFTNTRWVLGYVVGLGGWGLYIAALLFAPISLVQAVSAGGSVCSPSSSGEWPAYGSPVVSRRRSGLPSPDSSFSASRSPPVCRGPSWPEPTP